MINDNMEHEILQECIEQLKSAKTDAEIQSIECTQDDLNWMFIAPELQDEWYETLGDAKRGLYF